MRIGIDIDEVLCETIDYVLAFQNYKIAGIPIKRSDFTDYYIKNISWFEHLDQETTISFFYDAINALGSDLSALKPVQWALQALTKAKKSWHQLYAITARWDNVKTATLERINQHFPDLFEEVIFCNYHEANKISKEEVCKNLGIQVFVEDNLRYAQALAQEGIKSFLLAKERNTTFKAEENPNIFRVENRDAVDFDKVIWTNNSAKKYYLTTAIPYMNWAPHAWHALEIVQADALARMQRFIGKEVVFQTGSDDHGMKNRNTAAKEGLEVREFIKKNAQLFLSLYKQLDISYTDFIHTSDEQKHYPWAQLMRKRLQEAGDIYKKSYTGLYCEGCEAMKLEKDLVDGHCPDHPGKQLQEIQEENYFFRLSKYKDQIKNLIESDEYRIEPEIRKNEILAFLEKAEDVSFSRQKNKMPWGIPVPWDDEHVMYVWCDALTNYITGQGFGRNDDWQKSWPADLHIVGKDILRFHAAFWPAMLLSAKLPLPKTLLAHGHLTLNGEKMSKSTGNVIDPSEVIEKYGRDAFVFNLLYDVSLNADGDFSVSRLENVYNSMLIGAWGNLVNRVISLCKKYGIEKGIAHSSIEKEWKNLTQNQDFETFFETIDQKYLQKFDLQGYLQERYKYVQAANELITKEEPWKKYKDEATREQAIQTLEFLLYVVKNLSILSAPILTQGFDKMKNILGYEEMQQIDTSRDLDPELVGKALKTREFSVKLEPEILYQRIEN